MRWVPAERSRTMSDQTENSTGPTAAEQEQHDLESAFDLIDWRTALAPPAVPDREQLDSYFLGLDHEGVVMEAAAFSDAALDELLRAAVRVPAPDRGLVARRIGELVDSWNLLRAHGMAE